MSDEIFTNKGKLSIKDSKAFINMLYDQGGEDIEFYNILKNYAYKQKSKMASEIPTGEFEHIMNMAIVASIKDFKPEKKAELQSYFWSKLRGEISSYRAKRDSLQKKVLASINENNGDSVYVYQKTNEGEENTLESVEVELMDEKIEREDKYFRQMKAFKMAFGGIPRILQIILTEIGNNKKISEVAYFLNLPVADVSQKRNYALSLILQRIMRSNHLNENEKKDLAEMHGFEYSA